MNHHKRTPLLYSLYQQYLVDQDLAAFGPRVGRRYRIGTLERLTTVGDRMVRRAAVLALGQLADFSSNAVLGRALLDADRGVRMLAENGIRMVWCRCGTTAQQERLRTIIELVTARRFEPAIDLATQLIAEAPSLAEAWNQRAVALFGTGRFEESIRDCHRALEFNPYHFAAATGLAQCHLQRHERASAVKCFERALGLNPNLEGVRAQLVYLQRTHKGQE
jgi:tetratricopeptide (TPR) repeat protein